jgi:hypothetical protein
MTEEVIGDFLSFPYHPSDKHHGVLGIFIDPRLIFNALGTMCITKGAEGLVVIVVDGTYASAHHRFGVATQRILQGQAWHEVCL